MTPSDVLFMVLRWTNNLPAYSYSTNGGTSWSAPTYTNGMIAPNGTTIGGKLPNISAQQYVYAQGFYDSTTNSLLYDIGQGDFSSADILFQQFSPPI